MAIGAHGLWKQALAAAIASGKSQFTIETIGKDELCDLGKWLHRLPESDRASEHWEKIHSLHEQFHIEAAKVLDAALAGHKAEASASMRPGGGYCLISMQLTAAMMEWIRVL